MNPILLFLKGAIAHWKTSIAGIAAAALIVSNSYQSGMTWKQWGIAAFIALIGLAAHDGTVPVPQPIGGPQTSVMAGGLGQKSLGD